ncbi:hypothetical protein V6N13_088967 [Hibiscus sabdariffa]|uniref:ATP synthase subunit d, mitochondrial n=1 Tax=Hibiscus sabdariffa TaxID=183260 RepID=A0ABR2G1Y0_9ROSI
MSGRGKKVVDVAFKASKDIDWEGMTKLLVSDAVRKEFAAPRRTFYDVNSTLFFDKNMVVKPTVALRAFLVGGIIVFAKLGAAATAMAVAESTAMTGSKQDSNDGSKQPQKDGKMSDNEDVKRW